MVLERRYTSHLTMIFKPFTSSIRSAFLLIYTFALTLLTIFFITKDICILYDWNIAGLRSCPINFTLILDPIRLSFRNLVCFISGCVIIFSSRYISHDPFIKRFTWLVILFVISMNLLIFIPRLPALLLGWDGLGIVSFALVIYYQNMKSLAAGMLTVLANRIGDVMILISIGLLVLQGHWTITLMWDFHLSAWVVMTILLAAITKSAQIPFSAWLPAAIAAPTPVSALVHSSTLVTAGVFLLIRFYPFLSLYQGFKTSLLFISVMTLLLAGAGANYENDLKKIIALSTLSQLGVIIISLAIGIPYLALFHLYTHALFKALLFLCAGAIIHNRSNWQDVRSIGIIFSQLPLTTRCLNVANLSLCGAPFLRGFYSKDLILEISLLQPTRTVIVFLIFIATGITTAYSLRLSFCSLWGTVKGNSFHAKQEKDNYINASTLLLSLAAVVAGFLLQVIFLEFNPQPFILPLEHKGLTILVVVSGLFLARILWDSQFTLKRVSKGTYFLSSIWFLALISAQPLTKISMNLGTSLIKSIDQGWLECVGGQGAFFTSRNLSSYNQRIQIKTFNFLILSMRLPVSQI